MVILPTVQTEVQKLNNSSLSDIHGNSFVPSSEKGLQWCCLLAGDITVFGQRRYKTELPAERFRFFNVLIFKNHLFDISCWKLPVLLALFLFLLVFSLILDLEPSSITYEIH